MNSLLPPDITCTRQHSGTVAIYTFRHRELGELGRMVLTDYPDEQTQVSCEVVGESDDPMTLTRLAIFQPLTESILQAMATQPSDIRATAVSPLLPSPTCEPVESKMLPCEVCGHAVALLIFAAGAQSPADFEDYARKMFHVYRDMNVPTWIIGDSLGVPGFNTPSCVMKVWPARENIRQLTPTDFNADLDRLLAGHCGP
jgi:hypothetical protein